MSTLFKSFSMTYTMFEIFDGIVSVNDFENSISEKHFSRPLQ